MSVGAAQNRYVASPAPSGLADVVDLILDKGLVIDLYVRVSLIGIEILTIDARIVVASVDTYLRFAEAVGRLNIESDGKPGLPELMEDMTGGGGESRSSGAIEGAEEEASSAGDDGADDEKRERAPARRERPRRRGRQENG